MKTLVLFALAVMLAGCGEDFVRKSVPMGTPFSAETHAPFSAPGTASIKGQGFLRQRGGGVVTCAGSEVFVLPDTLYFREMLEIFRAGDMIEGGVAEEPKKLGRVTMCDAQGNFVATGLPAAKWLVATQVRWIAGDSSQGGELLREVTTTDGETTVFLTEANQVGPIVRHEEQDDGDDDEE